MPSQEWINFKVAADIMGGNSHQVRKLVRAEQLTVRQLPFSKPRVLKSEVEALALASTRPAKANA